MNYQMKKMNPVSTERNDNNVLYKQNWYICQNFVSILQVTDVHMWVKYDILTILNVRKVKNSCVCPLNHWSQKKIYSSKPYLPSSSFFSSCLSFFSSCLSSFSSCLSSFHPHCLRMNYQMKRMNPDKRISKRVTLIKTSKDLSSVEIFPVSEV